MEGGAFRPRVDSTNRYAFSASKLCPIPIFFSTQKIFSLVENFEKLKKIEMLKIFENFIFLTPKCRKNHQHFFYINFRVSIYIPPPPIDGQKISRSTYF